MTPRELALRSLVKLQNKTTGGDDFSSDEPRFDIIPAKELEALSSRDRDLTRELVNGVLRNRCLLDWMLKKSLARGRVDLNPWERNILRLGAYQLLFMDRIPAYAAVDQSVWLSKRYGRRKTVGLTNAVLRDIIKKRHCSFHIGVEDPVKILAIKYSHPQWLVKRWIKELGPSGAEALLAANNQPALVMASPNPGRITYQELFDELTKEGFCPRPHSFVDGAVVIERPAGLFSHRLFLEGYLHIQDASSQLVGRLLGPMSGGVVLDICAAPGGKTCWWAMHHPRSTIVAIDISCRRLRMVRENLIRLGLKNVFLACADGLQYRPARLFDSVLLDAPCSGLGTLRRRLDLRWRIGEKDILRLSTHQWNLLENAARLVRPGGFLIYSTCTLTREENQDQIERFLMDHPDFELMNVKDQLPSQVMTDGFMQTWPQHHEMDGMFAAKMRRIG